MNNAATIHLQAGSVFRDGYTRFSSVAREGKRAVSEMLVQSVWHDQLFNTDGLITSAGQPLSIVSPGWWNRSEGPDFRGAQIRFGETVRTGDIEVHLDHGAWRQHGHHTDPRYDNVILTVVLETKPPSSLPVTSAGRPVACLLLGNYVDESIYDLPDLLESGEYEIDPTFGRGYCSAIAELNGSDAVQNFVRLAGEHRMLTKARTLRDRIERAGLDQAVYEAFMAACGYSQYKLQFKSLAQHLPYDRIVQLARIDPFLLEAALLRLGGLLPEDSALAVPHLQRLLVLANQHLSGLKSLPLAWKRIGVRPNNYPERRISGAARFLARHVRVGLWNAITAHWQADMSAVARRRAFESLFPSGMGFWAEHYTWDGKRLAAPTAPLGPSRIRTIIGNVFIPCALAVARKERDRELEERAFALFAALPKEADNRIVVLMLGRVFGNAPPKRVDFRLQQGLLQVYQDWCEPNPSCRKCPVIGFLDPQGRAAKAGE